MNRQIKPQWKSLAQIGLLLGAVLILESRLPVGPADHSWLLGIWVLIFYGAVAVWTTHNREALERVPRPRDMTGRPIMDVDAPELEQLEENTDRTEAMPAARPFRQSEPI